MKEEGLCMPTSVTQSSLELEEIEGHVRNLEKPPLLHSACLDSEAGPSSRDWGQARETRAAWIFGVLGATCQEGTKGLCENPGHQSSCQGV